MGRHRRVLGFESSKRGAKGGKHREHREGSTGYAQRGKHKVQRGEHQEHREGSTKRPRAQYTKGELRIFFRIVRAQGPQAGNKPSQELNHKPPTMGRAVAVTMTL
jgi:hypothetical protein